MMFWNNPCSKFLLYEIFLYGTTMVPMAVMGLVLNGLRLRPWWTWLLFVCKQQMDKYIWKNGRGLTHLTTLLFWTSKNVNGCLSLYCFTIQALMLTMGSEKKGGPSTSGTTCFFPPFTNNICKDKHDFRDIVLVFLVFLARMMVELSFSNKESWLSGA